MAQDSSSDLTAVLLGLEERIAEKIRQQFVAISDRLDAVSRCWQLATKLATKRWL